MDDGDEVLRQQNEVRAAESLSDGIRSLSGEFMATGGGRGSGSAVRLDLPTYDEAIDPESAPPPSYDSLFGRVREARKSSKGLVDFAKNVLILLLGTSKSSWKRINGFNVLINKSSLFQSDAQ